MGLKLILVLRIGFEPMILGCRPNSLPLAYRSIELFYKKSPLRGLESPTL